MRASDKPLLGATVSLIEFTEDGTIKKMGVLTSEGVEYQVYPVRGGEMDIT